MIIWLRLTIAVVLKKPVPFVGACYHQYVTRDKRGRGLATVILGLYSRLGLCISDHRCDRPPRKIDPHFHKRAHISQSFDRSRTVRIVSGEKLGTRTPELYSISDTWSHVTDDLRPFEPMIAEEPGI